MTDDVGKVNSVDVVNVNDGSTGNIDAPGMPDETGGPIEATYKVESPNIETSSYTDESPAVTSIETLQEATGHTMELSAESLNNHPIMRIIMSLDRSDRTAWERSLAIAEQLTEAQEFSYWLLAALCHRVMMLWGWEEFKKWCASVPPQGISLPRASILANTWERWGSRGLIFPNLRMRHYEMVKTLDDNTALDLLREASEENWTVERLNKEIRALRQRVIGAGISTATPIPPIPPVEQKQQELIEEEQRKAERGRRLIQQAQEGTLVIDTASDEAKPKPAIVPGLFGILESYASQYGPHAVFNTICHWLERHGFRPQVEAPVVVLDDTEVENEVEDMDAPDD